MPRRKGASEAHGVCVCGNVPSRAAEASVEVFVADSWACIPVRHAGFFYFMKSLKGAESTPPMRSMTPEPMLPTVPVTAPSRR